MLVLSRKSRESVVIGGIDGIDGIRQLLKVTVLEIAGGKVRLGFEADITVPVLREEVWRRDCTRDQIGRDQIGTLTDNAVVTAD